MHRAHQRIRRHHWLIAAAAACVATIATLTVTPRTSSALATPGVAIAPSGNDIWVVRGDRVYVCRAGLARAGNAPPAPICGKPTALR